MRHRLFWCGSTGRVVTFIAIISQGMGLRICQDTRAVSPCQVQVRTHCHHRFRIWDYHFQWSDQYIITKRCTYTRYFHFTFSIHFPVDLAPLCPTKLPIEWPTPEPRTMSIVPCSRSSVGIQWADSCYLFEWHMYLSNTKYHDLSLTARIVNLKCWRNGDQQRRALRSASIKWRHLLPTNV